MKKQVLILAALAALGGAAQAQDSYVGLGLPGLLTLGYASPMGSNWGLRGEFAGGLSASKDGITEGVNARGSVKANRVGVFADYFPFGGGFRLVGGLTANDIKGNFDAIGSGTSVINGKTVNMAGEFFSVELKYPSVTPYLGIGYGHQASTVKGLGFYADLGVMVGSFDTSVKTSLANKKTADGKSLITQSDIDAQTQKLRDSVSSLSVLPSVSLGLVYRY